MGMTGILKRFRPTSWAGPTGVLLASALLAASGLHAQTVPATGSVPGDRAGETSLPGALAVQPVLLPDSEVFVVEEYRPLAFVGFRLDPILVTSPTRVRFDVVGGTAVEGEDYWIDVKTVLLDPEVSSYGLGILRIRLQDVDAPEPDETILLDASIEGSDRKSVV